MKYEHSYEEFKNFITEGETFYKIKERENLIDDSDGIHLMFGLVIVPYIIEMIYSGKKEIIEKIFAFLEEMSLSEDRKIQELLEFTVLESLIDQGQDFVKCCKQFMGVHTLKACEKIERYFNKK